jgi:hypothetical protein
VLEIALTAALWIPHLTVQYGTSAQGYTQTHYWYRIQDSRRENLEIRTFGGELAASRWLVSGTTTSIPSHDARNKTLNAFIAPIRLGPLAPGIGGHIHTSEQAPILFSGVDAVITAPTKRSLITGVVEIGVGDYDRSHLRIQGMYGRARANDSLHLTLLGEDSPVILAPATSSHTTFTGAGATAAIRLYGISLEGSAACYRPRTPTVALPGDECVVSGGGSILLPLWGKFGSGAGGFVRYTRVNGICQESMQFFSEGFTVGFIARIP